MYITVTTFYIRLSRQLNNKSNNADQMVQNILRWLQDVYGQQSRTSRSYMLSGELEPPFSFASARIDRRAFRQGSLREYLPPTNSQKPRPFEPRPNYGAGLDDNGNFVDTGYPPAGSITPQPPFTIYTNPATGGITGISSPGEDISGGPGSTGYPTQAPTRPPYRPGYPSGTTYIPPPTYFTDRPGIATQPPTQITERPPYSGETERPAYPGETQTPGFPGQTPSIPEGTPGYPSGPPTEQTQGYPTSSPSGFTGYPSGRPQETVPTRYPTGETGYPTYPTGRPQETGPTRYPTGETRYPTYPTSSPSGFTGYTSGPPSGIPTFPTSGPTVSEPAIEPVEAETEPTSGPQTGTPGPGPTTGVPIGTPGFPTIQPPSSTGYPAGSTLYPIGSTGYPAATTPVPGFPTGSPPEGTSPAPAPTEEVPGPTEQQPSEPPSVSTGAPTGPPDLKTTAEPPTGLPGFPTAPTGLPGFPTASTGLPPATPTVEVPDETVSPNGETGIQEVPDDLKHPPHIHALDVECAKDMMTIKIEFNREFNGVIYSKGYYNMPECRYVNENSGLVTYTFTVNLNMCGTEFVNAFDTEGQSYLENILVLQNEDGIQEEWDTVRSVRCLWEGNLKEQLSVTLMVGMLSQEIVTFSGDTAMAKLDVLLGRGPFGQPVNGLVKIGEQMTLAVSVSGDPGFDVQVKDCRATDSSGAHTVALSDDSGCILKPKLFGAFQKTRNTGDTGASIIAYAYFNAFKFPDVMDVMIECNIELCKTDCEMCPDVNAALEPAKRRKRDVSLGNETLHDSIMMAKHLRVVLPEDLATALDLAQHDGVCMSTQSFVYSSSVLISLLTASCLLSAYLWVKTQRLRMKH